MHRTTLITVLALLCTSLTWGCIQMQAPAPTKAQKAQKTLRIVMCQEPVHPYKTATPTIYDKIQKRINAHDRAILLQVARDAKLNHEQTEFLLIIRIIENGRPGLEMGVGDGIPKHPARRYAGNHDKSLRLQAQWVAGAIKKRFKSYMDTYTFAKRHCPLNTFTWYWNARNYMKG